MPQNANFDQGSMIVDSKMNEDNMEPDGDVPF